MRVGPTKWMTLDKLNSSDSHSELSMDFANIGLLASHYLQYLLPTSLLASCQLHCQLATRLLVYHQLQCKLSYHGLQCQ